MCDRDNWLCIHGCIDGYDGEMCETVMSTKQRGGTYYNVSMWNLIDCYIYAVKSLKNYTWY